MWVYKHCVLDSRIVLREKIPLARLANHLKVIASMFKPFGNKKHEYAIWVVSECVENAFYVDGVNCWIPIAENVFRQMSEMDKCNFVAETVDQQTS